tara:strand:- start:23 stop:157 length:135 start_codon:yes stop_codon:yes gene_type:complete
MMPETLGKTTPLSPTTGAGEQNPMVTPSPESGDGRCSTQGAAEY